MTGAVLFEFAYHGDVWRLEVSEHKGGTFAQFRKWWRDGDTLKPSRQRNTIPLGRFPAPFVAIEAYLAAEAPYGPKSEI